MISSHPGEDQNDLRFEKLIGNLLQWSVWISLFLVCVGTLLCFLSSNDYGIGAGSSSDLQRMLQPAAKFLFGFQWFVHGLFHMEGQAIIVAGLLVLIATPILRVAILVGTYLIEKDWTYVIVSSIVFLLLIISFFMDVFKR